MKPAILPSSKLFSFPPKTGEGFDRRVEHSRQFHVDPVNHLAGGLVERVETLQRFAGDLPVARVLERNVGGRREFRRGLGDLAVGCRAAGRGMGDNALFNPAFGGRELPVLGGRLDQHMTRHRAALAHVILRRAHAQAAARDEIAPDAAARRALAGRRKFSRHLRPVAVEFLGDELGETGQRALAHFGAGDPNDDGFVRPDNDPGVDLRGFRGARRKWNDEAERKAAAERCAADDEVASADGKGVAHAGLPLGLGGGVDGVAHLLVGSARQMLVMAESISASVGCGFSVSRAATAMITPVWQ